MKLRTKLIVSVVGLVAAGFLGYTFVQADETTNEINQTWIIKSEKIDLLKLEEAQQNIKVNYSVSEDNETHVTVKGKVSDGVKEALKKSKVTAKELNLIFNESKGLGLAIQSPDTAELTVEISVPVNGEIKELNIEMICGNVEVGIPSEFDGIYETKARDNGKTTVPKTNKTMKNKIKIDTSGDIVIHK